MVARSQKKIDKAHALRKRVKLKKQRIRKMHAKKVKAHGKYPKAGHKVHIKLEPEVREVLMEYCFKNNVKPYKAARQLLTLMVNTDWSNLKAKLKEEGKI